MSNHNNKQFFINSNYSLIAALLTNQEVEMVDVEANGTGGHQILLTPYNLCNKLANDYELNRLVAPAKQLAMNVQAIKQFVNKRRGGQRCEY